MGRTSGSWAFFLNTGLIAVLLALAVYQVPQPWRGFLVGLLFIGLLVGFFALQVLRYQQGRRGAMPNKKRSQESRRRLEQRTERRAQRPARLEIVRLDEGSSGRHTIR